LRGAESGAVGSCVIRGASSLRDGDTIRITINGPALKSPLAITEGAAAFEVWSHQGESLIANWAGGAVTPPNPGPTYEVTFHTTRMKGPKTYLVLYRIDPATGNGYVYIPGSDHAAYKDNTWLIIRGVEGSAELGVSAVYLTCWRSPSKGKREDQAKEPVRRK
jgi:hypothetical protein